MHNDMILSSGHEQLSAGENQHDNQDTNHHSGGIERTRQPDKMAKTRQTNTPKEEIARHRPFDPRNPVVPFRVACVASLFVERFDDG